MATTQTTASGHPPWHPPGAPPAGWRPFPESAVASSIGARLQAVADEHGDRIALRGPGVERTYTELLSRVRGGVTAVADRLGGTQGEPRPVAVLAAHGPAQIEALLGVIAAGHPALVLDPVAPAALGSALVADADVGLVLADATHAPLVAELAPGRPVLDLAEVGPETGALPDVDPGAVAMLAYTSGSSGDAKAAMVPHRQLLHLMRGASDSLAIHPDDRLPMLFPISLAVASYPALLPLLTGASLTTFDVRGEGFAGLAAWLAGELVTVAYLAPTVVKFLEGSIGDVTFPELRLVVLGGERVDQGAVDLTRSMFGDHVLVANGYGTTETGVLSFWFTPSDGGPVEAAIPAGYPIPGMDLAIVGEDGRRLPAGATGELTVRSRYLFSGYRGRPDLDAMVLRPEPDGDGATYRTGDLARLDEHGALELVGRIDTQVKVRGRRVVLGEVEELVLGLDAVRDAAVVAGSDGAGHTVVTAHVVSVEAEAPVTVDVLRAALAATTPSHMVPATFVLHDALPQLPNGKLDRRALVDVAAERPPLSTVYVPPDDELEEQLVVLWESMLGVSPIGVEDDFFDLGGNSLLASRMLVELESQLGHRVPMAALIDGVTVRGLAVAVADHEAGRRRASGLVTIQEGSPDRPVLYVAHDLHGSTFRFRHFAAALGADQPVKGFESPALTGEPFPFTRIETLALRYATELQRAQPSGPYHLCGYSFGGIVAFEMARHLRRAGEEVALLSVIDIGPGYRGLDYDRRRPPRGPWLDLPAPPDEGTALPRRIAHHARVAVRSPRDAGTYAVFNSRFRRRLLPIGWRWQFRRHGKVLPRHRLWYAYQSHWDLVGPSWSGAPYDGDVLLFWSEDTASADATMGWGALGATVDIRRIPVGHERIMDEGEVHHVAGPLREALDATLAR